jgi:tRNA(Ile)-lysidine synthetase-like protein
LRAQVRQYAKKHHLFQAGPVVIGVSGGVDSLVLLHVLRDLCADFQITLHVATLDHSLRGADSAADAEFVRQTAELWSIPVTVGQVDVNALAKVGRLGIEDAARQARYQFLIAVAEAVGSTQIAVAHHRNDQAETVLMHLLRGSGLTGLRGMLPSSALAGEIKLIRPLLDTSRTAIDSYAAAQGLIPRIDATNADPHYARNRIRLEILPVLRTVNPALDTALAHTAEVARADYDALQWALREQLPDWPKVASRTVFQALPRGLQRLAVHQLAPEWRFEQVEALIDWLLKATGGQQHALPDGAALLVTLGQFIYVTRSELPDLVAPAEYPTLPDSLPHSVTLPGTVSLAVGWQLEAAPYSSHSDTAIVLDLTDPLIAIIAIPDDAVIMLRTRQDGDRFRPKGLNGHSQKLSDTLIDLKVPVAWRDQLPLLTVNGQIAWFVAPTPDGLKARLAEPFQALSGQIHVAYWCFVFHHK